MRYAVFSDIHGNLEALDAVLEFYKDQSIDRYVFLGDAVGYGANPDEVCTRLREFVDVAIMGNHDAAVAGRMDYAEYYDAARHALDWCVSKLSPTNMEWLKGLPFKVRENDLEFCHGAPVVPEEFEYLFASEQVLEVLATSFELASVTFIGHSHLTVSFQIDGESVVPILAEEVACPPETKHIITVGSVGQPRDRDPRSCCGIYDSETRTFRYNRLEYDVLAARQKILDAGLSSVFGERLLVGM